MVSTNEAWNDAYWGHDDCDALWQQFQDDMYRLGFDNMIIYSYAMTPVRHTRPVVADLEDCRNLESNQLRYLLGGTVDPKQIEKTVMGQNLIELDPLYYHMINHGTPALIGLDFTKEGDAFHEETVKFFTIMNKATGTRNTLLVPLYHFNIHHPQGFGLHSTMPASDLEAMVTQNYAYIYMQALNFAHAFDYALRKKKQAEMKLTKKQIEVLNLICMGFANAEIAYKLDVAEPTVSFHLKQIMERLQLTTPREIPLAAVRYGLVHVA